MGTVGRLGTVCALAVLVVVAMATASGAQDAEIVIETQITFSDNAAPSGTFEVISGADSLGCDSGSFVDTGPTHIRGTDLVEVTKTLTCESGPNAGTISILFMPDEDVNDANRQTGPWEIKEATGDFVGLVGGGDYELVFDSERASSASAYLGTGVETFTGSITLPESSELAQTGSETTTAMLVGGTLILFGLVALALRPRLHTR
jgi:hypothetical protein